MQEAVGEAVMAYNSDINEHGVAPIQLVTGRIPNPVGDVLNHFSKRLAEHSLLENSPSLERQLAVRQTPCLAMLRLLYSRGLRLAELARRVRALLLKLLNLAIWSSSGEPRSISPGKWWHSWNSFAPSSPTQAMARACTLGGT